jgi:hypothetical protein
MIEAIKKLYSSNVNGAQGVADEAVSRHNFKIISALIVFLYTGTLN